MFRSCIYNVIIGNVVLKKGCHFVFCFPFVLSDFVDLLFLLPSCGSLEKLFVGFCFDLSAVLLSASIVECVFAAILGVALVVTLHTCSSSEPAGAVTSPVQAKS